MKVPRSLAAVLLAAGATAAVGVADARHGDHDAGFRTEVKPYAKGVPGSGWITRPLLSAGDVVPETGNRRSPGYRMVGLPDGLGAYTARGRGRWDGGRGHASRPVTVLMTHEAAQADRSEPRVGRPGQRGAFASEYLITRDGRVLSGRRAFDRVYQDSRFVGPAADESNATPAFSRWCSAFLAGSEVGFDRRVFFANEEASPEPPSQDGTRPPTRSFDPLGSQSVAIFGNEAHALSGLGHFPRENTVVMPRTGAWTVILSTEDGPAKTTDSQLYMYRGRKDRSSRDPLRRNGLVGGRLYAFASDDARDSENAILQGDSVAGHWVEIAGAAALSDVQTEAAVDAAGAFGFARVEDGMFNRRDSREFWFNTTGEQVDDSPDPHLNELGRVYRLRLKGTDPRAGAVLTQEFNPDELAPDEDGPLTPDNLDVTGRWIVDQEDGTGASRPEMEQRDRDGSIWMLPTATPGDTATFRRVVELVGRSEGGRDGIRTGAGMWESSGIIDTSREFGRDTFLFDVQAHPPTTPPGGTMQTREDGQLLLLRRGR
jgi:hypothetical protein